MTSALQAINKNILNSFCRQYSKAAFGKESDFDDFEILPRGAFIRGLELESVRHDKQIKSVAETREKVNQTFYEVISKIKNSCKKAGIPAEFCIQSIGEKGSQTHGIKLPPERIKLTF